MQLRKVVGEDQILFCEEVILFCLIINFLLFLHHNV